MSAACGGGDVLVGAYRRTLKEGGAPGRRGNSAGAV